MSTRAQVQAVLDQLVGQTITRVTIEDDEDRDLVLCELLTLETVDLSVAIVTASDRESWLEVAK